MATGCGRCGFARRNVELGIYDRVALYEFERNTKSLSNFCLYLINNVCYTVVPPSLLGPLGLLPFLDPHLLHHKQLWKPALTKLNPSGRHLYVIEGTVCAH